MASVSLHASYAPDITHRVSKHHVRRETVVARYELMLRALADAHSCPWHGLCDAFVDRGGLREAYARVEKVFRGRERQSGHSLWRSVWFIRRNAARYPGVCAITQRSRDRRLHSQTRTVHDTECEHAD